MISFSLFNETTIIYTINSNGSNNIPCNDNARRLDRRIFVVSSSFMPILYEWISVTVRTPNPHHKTRIYIYTQHSIKLIIESQRSIRKCHHLKHHLPISSRDLLLFGWCVYTYMLLRLQSLLMLCWCRVDVTNCYIQTTTTTHSTCAPLYLINYISKYQTVL